MKKYTDSGKKDTRSGFGAGLLIAGKENPNVVALTADLKGSLKMDAFAAEFPERFIQCGIAEANMVGAAAGLAITGKVPFVGSFAEFVTGRVYDQIRQEVAYGCTNVKIASSHAGITLGEDGATHQTMEDIALMRALPGMTVLVPCDYNQTVQATLAAARFDGPVYLRFGRPSVPNFTDPDEPFVIGGATVYRELLPFVNRLYVTWVYKDFEGDTTFPVIDLSRFTQIGETQKLTDSESGLSYGYAEYLLRANAQTPARL